MRGRRLRLGAALGIAAMLLAVALSASAGAVTVRIGNLVLKADGGFAPRVLPKRGFAPIRFQGHASIATSDGSVPPALRHVRLEFDRDGRVSTAGLARCRPAQLADATPRQARRRCGRALVGRGSVEAIVTLPGQRPVTVKSPLSLFNGPQQGRTPSVLAHARTAFPAPETHVVAIPIRRQRGAFRYRVEFEMPEIAGGHGALTRIQARVGRTYRAGGRTRSYISARCSIGILQAYGRLVFADDTVLGGTLYRPCRARR